MIGSKHAFELNGVRYHSRKTGGEGPPFSEAREPIRAPNAQSVIGESQNKVNIRQELLVWRWSDWTGGEGSYKFNPQFPEGYYQGQQVDGWSTGGVLSLGPAFDVEDTTLTIDNTGSMVVQKYRANETLYTGAFLSRILLANDSKLHTWTGTGWNAGTSITGITGSAKHMVADTNDAYILDDNSIIRTRNTTSFTDFATSGLDGTEGALGLAGDYVYAIAVANIGSLKVTEFSKSASTPVTGAVVYEPAGGKHFSLTDISRLTTSSHSRLYICTQAGDVAQIHELTPSTAAGPAFGKVIGTIPSRVLAMEWAAGLLYMVVRERQPGGEYKMVLAYYDPLNRTYGVISVLEDVTDEANGFQFDSGDGFTNILLATHTGGGEGLIKLIDIVKGAVHTIAMADVVRLSTNDIDMRGIVRVDDDLVYAYNSSSTGATLQWDWDQYAGEDTHDGQPYVTSALWDFGVIEAKVLSSIRVECEPITSGWTVTVAYQLEGSGTWTDAGTLVEDDTGVTFAVSTGSSSVSFYNLRLRLTFSYAGSGSSSSLTPIVHHVEARAQLPGIVKVWNIQVDLSDDNSGAGPHKGSQKVENIQSAGDAGTVVVFKNGFVSASPNVFQSHDVVIDAYRIDLERPGEGYATLRLLERS